ncbi:multicopper oxidase family protein [Longimicrobium terrae]|uniref:multicopper oxidase family protein n=1 Tax=Longimicrobium terrae TaxID=1639882 RepID=UPI001619B27D|nr:multicopper oxidase family protein [Longimicrobium terrae]MBB4636546.1 FtsP/CotA-like multicopper oxidase with cupredoxin domain [Longimicrobium terrae]
MLRTRLRTAAGAAFLVAAACAPPVSPGVPAPSPGPARPVASRALTDLIARRGVLPPGPPLPYPDSIVSSNGVLNARLVAAPGPYSLGGASFYDNLYNGAYVPPTLVVSPGDQIALTLVNQVNTGQPSNLHYHGLNVTPLAPGDDVLLHIANGDSFSYSFPVPAWHRSGLYWYHPHPHGYSEPQVLGGMSGALVMRGLLETYFPQWTGVRERVMVLKDHVPANPADSAGGKIKSINGQTYSSIPIAPGEFQLWRFANAGADAYYNIRLVDGDGHLVPMLVLARDGNPVVVNNLYADSLFLPPSSRAEVIVEGGGTPYYILSDTVDTGPAGDPNPTVVLATAGTGGQGWMPAPTMPISPAQQALADTMMSVLNGVNNQRTFVFSENAAGDSFYINNAMYNPDSVATYVPVPSVEEWTLVNTSGEVHVFHIHQTDFIVTEINGVKQPLTGFVDTVNMPYAVNGVPSTVKVVINFRESISIGEFVYHCHILEHEDGGMMQNILLYAAGTTPVRQARPPGGMHGGAHH